MYAYLGLTDSRTIILYTIILYSARKNISSPKRRETLMKSFIINEFDGKVNCIRVELMYVIADSFIVRYLILISSEDSSLISSKDVE